MPLTDADIKLRAARSALKAAMVYIENHPQSSGHGGRQDLDVLKVCREAYKLSEPEESDSERS